MVPEVSDRPVKVDQVNSVAERPLRLAFHLIGGDRWRGGFRYQVNLLRAIKQYVPDRVTALLVCSPNANKNQVDELANCLDLPPIYDPIADRLKNTKHQLRCLLGIDNRRQFFNFQTQHQIDAVFENASLWGSRLSCPAIAWLPDFQHQRLKQYFRLKERLKREIGFRMQIKLNRTIMLSSDDAALDFHRLYPASKNPVCVVPFAVPFQEPLPANLLVQARKRYNLPEKYFMLPNQFWPHKNHKLILDALAKLRTEDSEIVVVLTGNKQDQSGTATYDMVAATIKDKSLENQCKLLGEIAYQDLQSLMQGSQALINPSRFEGWSTTVEEAKAISLPMLLSDIAVHREQSPNSYFFSLDDASSLAKLLKRLVVELPSGVHRDLNVEHAGLAARERQRSFAQSFADCVELAYSNFYRHT